MHTIALLAGARPNYMKIYPLWREMTERAAGCRPLIIHTGQHYDPLMNDVFFKDLGMPAPDHFLEVGSAPHGEQTGRVMCRLEPLLMEVRPDMLVVVGDVNSTVAGALVGVKLGIPVAHVEAGLRSRDRTMPEEINRIATDSICDLLLTPSPDADANLLREGVSEDRIRRVGNVMIDSLNGLRESARNSSILATLALEPQAYVAVTLHRPGNVDEVDKLGRIMDELNRVAARRPVVFPVHPRTRRILREHNLEKTGHEQLRLLDPVGYVDFLHLEANAFAVITDSGGVQEETTIFEVPCLTLRPNTERPITISEGTNRLVDMDRESLADAVEAAPGQKRRVRIPLWDGKTAPRIMAAIEDALG